MNNLFQKIIRIKNRPIVKQAGFITIGTGLGYLLYFLSLPILTRLYSDDDFGVAQVYLSVLTFLSVISCGKFELALFLPKTSATAIYLFWLGIIFIGLISLLFLFLCFLAPLFNITSEIIDAILDLKYYILIGNILVALNLLLTNYNLRLKQYKTVGITKFTQSAAQVATQLVSAYTFSMSSYGLVLGDIVGRSGGTLKLFKNFYKKEKTQLFNIKRKLLPKVFVRYKKFPAVLTWAAIINTASFILPPLIIGNFYGKKILGNISMVERIMNIPIILVAQSIAQVYVSKFSEKIKNEQNVYNYFLKIVLTLFMLSIIPTLILAIWGDKIFIIFFGQQWVLASKFSQMYSLFLLTGFTMAPIMNTLAIIERVNLQLLWDVSRWLVMISAIYLVHYLTNNIYSVVLTYVSVMSAFYLIYFLICLFLLKKNNTTV